MDNWCLHQESVISIKHQMLGPHSQVCVTASTWPQCSQPVDIGMGKAVFQEKKCTSIQFYHFVKPGSEVFPWPNSFQFPLTFGSIQPPECKLLPVGGCHVCPLISPCHPDSLYSNIPIHWWLFPFQAPSSLFCSPIFWNAASPLCCPPVLHRSTFDPALSRVCSLYSESQAGISQLPLVLTRPRFTLISSMTSYILPWDHRLLKSRARIHSVPTVWQQLSHTTNSINTSWTHWIPPFEFDAPTRSNKQKHILAQFQRTPTLAVSGLSVQAAFRIISLREIE